MKCLLFVASLFLLVGSAGGFLWMSNGVEPATLIEIQCNLPTEIVKGEVLPLELNFQNGSSAPIRVVGLTQC